MAMSDNYAPSRFHEIRDQVALYEATDGRQGGTLKGRPVIILAHRGAKTGSLRKTPLIRIAYRGGYLVVASYGGHHVHPLWYYNLIANPSVTVRDGADTKAMLAREVTGAEKTTLWLIADAAWPDFADYRAHTDRDIPIFVLHAH